jgi:hypothetical protein
MAHWPAQPIWLGITQPNRYWVGQTDPVRPLALTSLPLPSPLLRPRSPPPLEDSGPLWRFLPPSIEANFCLHAACLPTKWIWNPSPVRGDPLLYPTRVPALGRAWASPRWRCALVGLVVTERHRWKHPHWVLPVLRRRHGWSPPQAAPGRPREHCLAMPTRYAPGH